jgi:hypothetical protein
MSASGRQNRRCAICDSTERVEANHAGGEKHVAWFTSPLCGQHHDEFHAMLRQAGVNLSSTSDGIERIRRALAAIKVFEWMLLKRLEFEIHKRKVRHHE